MDNKPDEQRQLYTIGHSNQTLDSFVRLLKENYVQLLIDVRSYPFSRFAPQFNRESLDSALRDQMIYYRFAGKQLGGRPTGSEYYDQEGHVLYDRVASSEFFREGILQLKRVLGGYITAIMCSEENPTDCHRRLLISRVLAEDTIRIFHIRSGNMIEEEVSYAQQRFTAEGQLAMFASAEAAPWRSVRSVLRKEQPETSSRH